MIQRTAVFRGESQEVARAVIEKLDIVSHLQASFATGAFDSADAVFFLAWTALALFCATRVVEARRWR